MGIDPGWEPILRAKGLIDSEPIAPAKRRPKDFVRPIFFYGEQACEWMLPIEVVSEVNGSHSVRSHAARKSQQKYAVIRAMAPEWRGFGPLGDHCREGGKLGVTLTRLGGRKMDRDNLWGAFKYVFDGIQLILGIDDGWPNWCPCVEQEVGGLVGIRIRLEKAE